MVIDGDASFIYLTSQCLKHAYCHPDSKLTDILEVTILFSEQARLYFLTLALYALDNMYHHVQSRQCVYASLVHTFGQLYDIVVSKKHGNRKVYLCKWN